MKIASSTDLEKLEAQGLDVVFPNRTPWDILRHSAATWPDRTAIRYLKDAEDPDKDTLLTYEQFAQKCQAAARMFREIGVVPGKSVALLTQHTPSAALTVTIIDLSLGSLVRERFK